MKTITLYQRTKTGKTQEWSIWVVEQGESGYPEVHIRHGLTDGKKQTTYDVIKSGVNVGKANETTALQQAYLEMERKATKQREEGYKDSQEQAADDSLRTIDWSKPLPKELCFFKPKNSIDDSKLKKLDTAGHAVYSVKRDGLCHIAYVSDFGADMVSRRMDVVSDRFPHLTSTVKSLPAQTILLGEVIYEKDGRDDFNTCCSICRSDADEAQRKQDKLGKVKYYVFDVAFYKGECLLTTKTFAQRRELLLKLVKGMGSKYVVPSEVISKTHTAAMKEIKQRGLEGIVVWDSEGKMKPGEAYTFNGKAERPNAVWKYKPKYEMDLIARFDPDNGVGEWGSGKNKDKMKSVFLYQLEDGQESFVCKCGGGYSDEQRTLYSNPKVFPKVFEVEFANVIAGTGALRFPEFLRERQDKDYEECVLDQRIKDARLIQPESDDE